MRKFFSTVAILLPLSTCSAPVPAFAAGERISGQQLLTALTSEDAAHRNLGIGYVIGVFDAHAGGLHCTPAQVTNQIVVQATLELLKANAEPDGVNLLVESADNAVMRPLVKAFPCSRPDRAPVNSRDGSST